MGEWVSFRRTRQSEVARSFRSRRGCHLAYSRLRGGRVLVPWWDGSRPFCRDVYICSQVTNQNVWFHVVKEPLLGGRSETFSRPFAKLYILLLRPRGSLNSAKNPSTCRTPDLDEFVGQRGAFRHQRGGDRVNNQSSRTHTEPAVF